MISKHYITKDMLCYTRLLKPHELLVIKSNNIKSKGVCSTTASVVILFNREKVFFLCRIYVLSCLRFFVLRYCMVAKVLHWITALATRVWNIRLGYQSGSLSLHSTLLLPLVVVLPLCRVRHSKPILWRGMLKQNISCYLFIKSDCSQTKWLG